MLACAPTALTPLRDGTVALDSDEGILIIDVDANFPIGLLRIGDREIRRLAMGPNVRAVRVPAGRYRFEFADSERSLTWTAPFQRYGLDWLDGNQLDVRAGEINYPGRLILRVEHGSLWFSARLVNRSSAILPVLQARYPEMLRAHPLRYSGPTPDAFFDVYFDTRRALQPHAPAGDES